MILKQKKLNSKEKKDIVNMIVESFGYSGKLEDYDLFSNNKDKIHIINKESLELSKNQDFRIDNLGMYFGEKVNEKEFRLTIEGSILIGAECSKNIVEISTEQMNLWMRGNDIEFNSDDNAFLIIKHESDFLGTGKLKEKVIKNFIPKSRRIHCSMNEDCDAEV